MIMSHKYRNGALLITDLLRLLPMCAHYKYHNDVHSITDLVNQLPFWHILYAEMVHF